MPAYVRLPGLLRLDRLFTVLAPFLLRLWVVDLTATALTVHLCPGGLLSPFIGRAYLFGIAGPIIHGHFPVDIRPALGAVFCPEAHAGQRDAAPHTGADVPPLARGAAQGLRLFKRFHDVHTSFQAGVSTPLKCHLLRFVQELCA